MAFAALLKRVVVDSALYDPYIRTKTIIGREYETNKQYYESIQIPCIAEVTDDLTGTDTILIASLKEPSTNLKELYQILIQHPSQLFKLYPPKILDKVMGVYADLLIKNKDIALLCWPICYHVIVCKGVYYVNVIWCWINTNGDEFNPCRFTWSTMQLTHAENIDTHWKMLSKRLQLSNGAKTRFITIEEAWDQAAINIQANVEVNKR